MYGRIAYLDDIVRQETTTKIMLEMANTLLEMGKMTFEEIAEDCKLPLEKIKELATKISEQNKEQ